MIVAIDGPGGVGKSSIAMQCASQLGFHYANSGLLYRIITAKIIENYSIDITDKEAAESLPDFDIENVYTTTITDKDKRARYYYEDVDMGVRVIPSLPSVRRYVNAMLYNIATRFDDIIAEGRDMTSVVFPEADIRIYLDADISERAKRRAAQLQNPDILSVQKQLSERDKIDSMRDGGSHKAANGVHLLDTTHMSQQQVCREIINKIDSVRYA